ncbi:beta-ketoacyl synthase chain length factor [Methylophilus sp. Leaf414]|uniref:beta-ketoacyl synthase chain length factor n=1 Tax=Methylophilus sp. Leaf414 TaxID=1736371 RepID=UPI0006F98F65|nr:beta-ketoacyl synthase chain length factor [Methylophilus sp. Leaf414]KQT37468.1 3-oxoacyl-ACP synthase [Methylophilus sp. Leaf414]
MSSRLTVYIDGIGLIAPGLNDWASGSQTLAGLAPYQSAKTVIPTPELLPAAERRRASDIVKVTLATSLEAISQAGLRDNNLSSVFSFSNGDGVNCHSICEMLASEDREISPTRFHNSVHNAAAGYWSIATKTMATSSVLCAFDGSFGAGLLDALTQVVVQDTPCILMTSDTPYPEPMFSKRPIPDNSGIALLLTPEKSPVSIAKITVSVTDAPAYQFSDAELETLRTAIPSMRGLPLLQWIARKESGHIVLDYLDDLRLAVEVHPC